MKLISNRLSLATAAFSMLLWQNVHAQGSFQWTVGFNGPPAIGAQDDIGYSYYSEQGMVFRPIGTGQFSRSGGLVSGRPSNGTPFLFAAFTDSLSITGTPSYFGVVSVDLAEYSIVVPQAVTVQFVGYRRDGSIVTQEFTTDGVMDGTGPLADFQTFYFDSRFADVTKVEVPTYLWSLDNMVFAQVPEPAVSRLLILAGILCLPFIKRKRYKTVINGEKEGHA